MKLLKEHVNIATKIYDKDLMPDLVKEFKIDEIEKCCDEIDRLQISKELYKSCEIIQQEMIKDIKTIEYIVKLHKAGIELIKTRDFINVIQLNGEKLTNYKIEDIIQSLQDSKMYDWVSYAYLKYFIGNIKSELGKRVVIENLEYFFTQNDVKIQDLSIDEIRLFTSPYLSNYNLIPRENIKRVYELLAKNKELKELICFLYINKLFLPLNIEEYQKININAKQIYKYLEKFIKTIDNELLYKFLLRWLKSGCNLYDLQILYNKIGNTTNITLENIVSNRSSYINFIFGNKLTFLNLQDISEDKEPLIIYAISNNKKSFLKLIEEHKDLFLKIPDSSILFEENFYSKYVNINSLNYKDLKDLQFMNYRRNHMYLLNGDVYTFNEIKTLYNSSNENCYRIYNNLLDLKIDDRLLRIKQIINLNISSSLSDDDIIKLSEKIKIKPLYNWIEEDFKHINEIKAEDVVRLLINYDDLKKFIKDINNRTELLYVLRNKKLLNDYNSLQEIKDNIEKIDQYWQNLLDLMKFSKEFIEKNKEYINTFLLNNGAELVYDYCESNMSVRMLESYKLIVKSELMGKFKQLKYHTNDLKKELDVNLEKFQIEEWTNNNISLVKDNIEVQEYDDFYSTMILGEEPMRTCLSYKKGAYNQCLLSCFDSNKKILYAKINGKIVARAMIRLTKGVYYNIKKTQSLSFVDVENNNICEMQEDSNEKLTIFLERPYISGISTDISNKVRKMFIEILKIKANKMNATLVLSNYYDENVTNEFIFTRYFMYISRSKVGTQYLDSLNGQATISDEGQYKENYFLIWKQKIDDETKFKDKIF